MKKLKRNKAWVVLYSNGSYALFACRANALDWAKFLTRSGGPECPLQLYEANLVLKREVKLPKWKS